MITRKVDRKDSNAGFIYDWVSELGGQVGEGGGRLYVICLSKGDINGLPENIEVYSMGKEKGAGKLGRILRSQFLVLKLIGKVDGVFTHMMPEYALLVGRWRRIFKKKLVHWYTHKAVPKNLIRAQKYVDVFVTASKESFRMETKVSVEALGHGISVEKFKPLKLDGVQEIKKLVPSTRDEELGSKKLRILSLGRISPSKDIETLIGAVEVLVNNKMLDSIELELNVVGGPGLPEQEKYLNGLKGLVRQKGLERIVRFLGPVPFIEVLPYFQKADIFVNLSHTGSVDKVVLEAVACGAIPLTCNEAFEGMLGDRGLMFEKKNAQNLADRIVDVVGMDEGRKEELKRELRQEVVENHSLDKTVSKILSLFEHAN